MGIAEQMGRVLQRTSISVNIKERLDFSCALFGPDGALVANAPHLPVHLGAMSEAVRFQVLLCYDTACHITEDMQYMLLCHNRPLNPTCRSTWTLPGVVMLHHVLHTLLCYIMPCCMRPAITNRYVMSCHVHWPLQAHLPVHCGSRNKHQLHSLPLQKTLSSLDTRP